MAIWEPLIVCSGVPEAATEGRKALEACDFHYLIVLLNVLIKDLVVLSTLMAGCVFAYAGFLLLTSGGSTNAMTKARDMFTKVLKGYLWILAAWLVVYTITSTLLDPSYFLLTK